MAACKYVSLTDNKRKKKKNVSYNFDAHRCCVGRFVRMRGNEMSINEIVRQPASQPVSQSVSGDASLNFVCWPVTGLIKYLITFISRCSVDAEIFHHSSIVWPSQHSKRISIGGSNGSEMYSGQHVCSLASSDSKAWPMPHKAWTNFYQREWETEQKNEIERKVLVRQS